MHPAADIVPSFEIAEQGPVSAEFLARQLRTFSDAADYVRNIPYGRPSDTGDLLLVLSENQGTCSTKHALLGALGQENHQPLAVLLGIYRMTEANTPGIGSILTDAGLDWIPEAHCCLRWNGRRLDFTRPQASLETSVEFIEEKEIDPNRVANDKTDWHRDFMRQWSETCPSHDFEALWALRERCIAVLSGSG